MASLTKRQGEYLDYMRVFFSENDQLPTVAALAAGMKVHPNAAQGALKRLEECSAIERNVLGKWRFYRDRGA